jgi:hypothetical protein
VRKLNITNIKVTKSGLRGFAAGIFFSTAVLSIAYYSEGPKQIASVQAESVVKAKAQDPTAQPIKEIQMPQGSSTAAAPVKPPQDVYTYRLVIERGMSPEEAAKKLEEARIIQDDKVLVKYLNDFSLMGSVRYGTYDLNSNMKIQEIAKIITKRKAK